MIAAARAGGAQVLLFPELSLTGYGVGEQTPALAMPRGHAVLARLAEGSRDLWPAAGFIEEGAAAQIYNSQTVLRDGPVAFVPRRLHPSTSGPLEVAIHFAPGRFLPPFLLAIGSAPV